jgi:hypothetical protein
MLSREFDSAPFVALPRLGLNLNCRSLDFARDDKLKVGVYPRYSPAGISSYA